MHRLLCIVGPTGTGKTAKAIEIAKLTPSILVSADSRQVYRGMDIVTGKDHPEDTPIYGIDIVSPDEPCSVAVWYDAVKSVIDQAWAADKLVIIVGGTGLYVKALTEGIPTMSVPINQSLRDELSLLSITQLQEKLWEVDPDKFVQFNQSDQDNPRRLVRAIEITTSSPLPHMSTVNPLETTMLGLKYAQLSEYERAVKARVASRLKQGAVEETKKLLTAYGRNLPAMSAIGYRSIIAHLEGHTTLEEMMASWVHDELAYAKRQLTWFAKVNGIKWYDRSITGREIYDSAKN